MTRTKRMPGGVLHPIQVALRIRRAVAEEHGITVEDMTSRLRTDRVAWARQMAMALISDHTPLADWEVGRLFNRTPGAAWHARRAVANRVATEALARSQMEFFGVMLGGRVGLRIADCGLRIGKGGKV